MHRIPGFLAEDGTPGSHVRLFCLIAQLVDDVARILNELGAKCMELLVISCISGV